MEKIDQKDLDKPFTMLVDGLKATWSNRYGAQYWFDLIRGSWENKEQLFDTNQTQISGHRIELIDNNNLFDDWLSPDLRENSKVRREEKIQNFINGIS